jgi:hypothetical protein
MLYNDVFAPGASSSAATTTRSSTPIYNVIIYTSLYTILSYILYYTILQYITLYHIALYDIISYHITLHYTVSYYIILYNVKPAPGSSRIAATTSQSSTPPSLRARARRVSMLCDAYDASAH